MAFDQPTRNRLAKFVGDARTLLTEEFTRQLQHEYGLDPASGEVTPVERLTALDDARRETARILRETMAYYLAGKQANAKNRQDVLDRIVREQAFTVLNRLCALRMAEGRALLIESIGHGYQSKGFQLFARLAGSALGETGEAYRGYLFSLFDEFAVDLPALFDRFSPECRLFPRETKLLDLLDLINDHEIDSLWAEDETVGWIYQYFNSQEERKQMRAESSAPRNSRELAVRNQFFTPRYVVEFLTDNTLGRIWYEMTRGETALAETCRYLMRRPNEIFLDEEQEVPQQEEMDEVLSQEELLKQPVYIPHRQLKDPREIKMLDPACGSMHFGLYAFDLFEQIYLEAWELEERLGKNALLRMADLDSLHTTYLEKEDFLRNVPRLIIERNIHGIDIDPRAVQIAGLSLWLRAQKSWQAQGLKPGERPSIRKSNIVCAEPMPGDRKMLEEFLTTLREDRLEALIQKALHVPAGRRVRTTKVMADALANLVRAVWQEMELAGEAGSLLKIQETLSDAIAQARKTSAEKAPLFRVLEYGMEYQVGERKGQQSDTDNGDFWSHADSLVPSALQEYAEQVENGVGYRRRLFAEDAAQGFAFIGLCRNQYDVVLMNPPFGSSPNNLEAFIQKNFEDVKNDLAAMFIKMGISRLHDTGRLGALTTRNILVLRGFQKWRITQMLAEGNLKELVDLGYGVLDDAMVEVSAYTISPQPNFNQDSSIFISCFGFEEKGARLQQISINPVNCGAQVLAPQSFVRVPGAVTAANISVEMISRISKWKPLEEQNVEAKVGLSTGEDERFLRLAWEVPEEQIGKQHTWIHLAKGGEWSPFWDDIHLLVNWRNDGKEIKVTGASIRNQDYYFTEGLTYPERTTSSFGPRILPANCIFTTAGQAIFTADHESTLYILGLLLSRPGQFLIELSLGSGDSSVPGTAARHYLNGMVNRLPFPEVSSELRHKISKIVFSIVNIKRDEFHVDENSRYFSYPIELSQDVSLLQSVEKRNKDLILAIIRCAGLIEELENLAADIFGLSDETGQNLLSEFIGPLAFNYQQEYLQDSDGNALLPMSESELVSSARSSIGLGKRYITKNCQLINKKYELISHIKAVSVKSVAYYHFNNYIPQKENLLDAAIELVSYSFGLCFGRWDIRFSIGKRNLSPFPDPFSPLPACPPGMLQNAQGLPAAPQDVPADYPLRISWDGVMVDDESHSEDVERRVRETLQVSCGERAETIEQEACHFLGTRTLREYFQKTTLFFTDHLKRYSKSRRQAPIYWPLSTPSGSYTLWLYYHRLNDQTLYTCVNDYVDTKLKQVSEDVTHLRLKKDRSTADEKELERLADFERELKDYRAELLRVAAFWKPNLNDGVQITAAPLWKLFQHKPWQKKLKETWEKLERGDYDWAHLAYSIWPERVRKKCKSGKSLAIAHGLEELYVEKQEAKGKKKKGKNTVDMDEMDAHFDE